MVTVRAPATVANLGSGFDVFGIALSHPADIIHVEPAEETTITVTGAGSQYIPVNPKKNTAGVVAEALDAPDTITIDKGIILEMTHPKFKKWWVLNSTSSDAI